MSQFLANPYRASDRPVPAPDELDPSEPLAFLAACPAHAATPLLRLPALARSLGLRQILLKDESARMGLCSFKALGGVFAVLRHAKDYLETQLGRTVAPAELISAEMRGATGNLHFVCASDGNHGRAVAAGARLIGARCTVYLHAHVSEERTGHIDALGATIVRFAGNYDGSVAQARSDALANGWTLISDTIDDEQGKGDPAPMRVMQGYGVIAEEILQELAPAEMPTHVLVQAGVGGLAAAIAARFAAVETGAPAIVVVEPDKAACLFGTCRAGGPTQVPDQGSTVYAMLECFRPSLPAWEVLRSRADAFMTVSDDLAAEAMTMLAKPLGSDPATAIGASGCSGLAGLISAVRNPRLREACGLDENACVLLIGTEGITDTAELGFLAR